MLTVHPAAGAPAAAAAASHPVAPQPTAPRAPVRRADGMTEVVDSTGRKLVLRDEIDIMDEQRLIIAVGSDVCANQLAFGRVMIAALVAEIDGERLDPPVTAREYEVLMRRVGKVGLQAVIDAQDAADAGDRTAADEAIAKNS